MKYKLKRKKLMMVKDGLLSGELEFNKIYNMDCVTGMTKLPDNSIDLVITDPPFAIDFKAQRSNYNRTSSRVLGGYA